MSGYSDITAILHECIKYYNVIPSNIRSSQTKIISFHITINGTTFKCCLDPNNLNTGLSGKRVKEL